MKRKIIIQYLSFRSQDLFEYHDPMAERQMAAMTDEQLCGYLFEQCQHLDWVTWMSNKKMRSMSVGDVIIIIDYEDRDLCFVTDKETSTKARMYQVAGVGFNKLN